MSFQSPLLNRVNHTDEAPLNSLILYNLNGGIFWIDVNNYSDFILQWIGTNEPPPLAMDLSSAGMHSLILDFDYKTTNTFTLKFILSTIESILKIALLPCVANFTYIVATRKGSKGIHVHLPEFKLGHDDYILFCESFQYKFKEAMCKNECYELDILSNAMLAGAAKPKTHPYKPTLVVYVEERKSCYLSLTSPQTVIDIKKNFKMRKNNEKSLFRTLLNGNSSYWRTQLKPYMMPVINQNPHPIHTLLYAATIGRYCNNSSDWQDVATFTYKKSNELGFISKCKNLTSNNFNLLKVYHYIQLNAKNMKMFETNNHALKMWFKNFSNKNNSLLVDNDIPELFQDVHEMLQFEHTTLAEDPNPIKTIMQFNDGYYFLPVFYALCRHYKMNSSSVAEQLKLLLDESFHSLLDKIRLIDPKNIQYTITDISINTLHFCANNLCDKQSEVYRNELKSIVKNNKRAILSVTTHDQIVDMIRSIQDRHLPIRVLKLKNALKKPNRYIWNALSECWQEIGLNSEVNDHIKNLWNHIEQFLNEYRASGGLGGPDNELIKSFNISVVISAIMSDTSMERKDVQMDNHKWFLRLQDGVLDLFTGHIGGVVPEFFLSDRKINIGIPRKEMMQLCNNSEKHVKLYEMLTDQKFFFKYLENLFLNVTDNLFDTLVDLCKDEEIDDELAKSMQHFYINLCKCTSFEYDMFMYMMDILASVYIGTNYERKFFVWKGLTRNGKSKLFELMGRVLGGYYHSIQSENLAPGHSANNATPELASTLFSCRMVTSEELEKKLNENRVKQITGNSFVAFRNLYEQNSGGIPTAKLFATTNNFPECKASEAFKDRVVAIPFDAEFTSNAPESTSEQVGTNTYMKDAYVVEQSFRGCFFMLYYHLKKIMSLDDGLLHYRAEPEYVVEYTCDYLIHTDIYVQFKIFMDVQLITGAFTTMNDVKSAVRQYLKTTKNTSFHETDIFICFEKEFGHLRRTDVHVENDTFSYSSILDQQDEPPQKKTKMSNDSMIVFYENVAIKNLKKTNLDV